MRKTNKTLWRGYTTKVKKILTTAVITTVKNDASGLSALLNDLLTQSLQPDEVIVILAGSDGDTEMVIKSFSDKLPLTCIVMSKKATRSQSRNKGVDQAKSSIIAFTDAGCQLDSDWLKELVRPFTDKAVQLVSGFTKVQAQTAWEEAQAHFVLVKRKDIETHPLPATRNMAILKSVFIQNKGFRDELNFAEDFEFARRLRANGVKAFFAPKALVAWRPRSNYKEFFLMISRLTAGDIQSGMLRVGHFTMWLRYFVFFIIFFQMSSHSHPQNAVFFLFLIYGSYIFLKVYKNKDLPFAQQLWFATFQPICDMAVLYGTVLGLVWRFIPRENGDT